MTYESFINNILATRGRFACGDTYHERHHIKPKSCGGTNDEDNLVDLYAREHFIAHQLLARENPDNDKLQYAYAAMAFMSNEHEERCELTPEEYEEARTSLSSMLKKRYTDKENHPSYGTHISEERKRRIGEINKGNKYCVGRVISEETRRKIGEANRRKGEETRRKQSASQKGRQAGANNARAKKVIRLSDLKVYGCVLDAARDNGVHRGTITDWIRNSRGFQFYNDWPIQNKSQDNI